MTPTHKGDNVELLLEGRFSMQGLVALTLYMQYIDSVISGIPYIMLKLGIDIE